MREKGGKREKERKKGRNEEKNKEKGGGKIYIYRDRERKRERARGRNREKACEREFLVRSIGGQRLTCCLRLVYVFTSLTTPHLTGTQAGG